MHAVQCSYAIMVLAFGDRWAHLGVVDGNHAIDDALGAKSMTDLNQMTKEELIALIHAAHAPRPLSMKVSEKGALSVYGLGRFPVTLYAGQWERLLANVDAIRAFMNANAALLATKD